MVRFIRKYRIAQNIALLCLLASCTTLPKVHLSVHINEPRCYGGYSPGYGWNRSYYLDTFKYYERCY